MRLICLNVGGGLAKGKLHEFIRRQAASTDIFCFQEVFNHAQVEKLGDIDLDLYTTIVNLLPDHIGYYAPSQDDDEGLAFFVKPHLKLDRIDDEFVHRYRNAMENDDRTTLGRNVQYIQFTKNRQTYTIMHFHGLWTGSGKMDTPDRLNQSRRIKEFIETKTKGRVVLVGDFNLEPQTESMAILERGMHNLIRDNGITSTRSEYYKGSNRFADYALVSNDVNVTCFEVLHELVSDHLPLLVEF